MSKIEAFLTNCRIADGRLVDIGIAGRKIVIVGEGAAASSNSAPALDIGGDLALPGLVDGHMLTATEPEIDLGLELLGAALEQTLRQSPHARGAE